MVDLENSAQMSKPRRLKARQNRVGEKIKQIRMLKNFTLADLAERMQLAISTLSKIENGKVELSIARLEAFAHELDVPLVEFLHEQPAHGANSFNSGFSSRNPACSRRLVTRYSNAVKLEAPNYLHRFHAVDLLRKTFEPVVVDVLCKSVDDYGEFSKHVGEEFNFIIEGACDFYSEEYAPVRLKVGDSIYFDAGMGHAHIKASSEPCRMIAIITPGAPGIRRPGHD